MRYVLIGMLLASLLSTGSAWAVEDCDQLEADLNGGLIGRRPVQDDYDRINAQVAACRARARQEQAETERRERAASTAERKRREREEPERAKKAQDEATAQAKAAADEQAAKNLRYNAIRANRKQLAAIFGAVFCGMNAVRAAALAEIAKEKKYARIAGYENKSKFDGLQRQIRGANEIAEKWKTDLRGNKGLAAAGCADPLVKRVLFCRGSDATWCDQLTMDMTTFMPADPSTRDDDAEE